MPEESWAYEESPSFVQIRFLLISGISELQKLQVRVLFLKHLHGIVQAFCFSLLSLIKKFLDAPHRGSQMIPSPLVGEG
jgi:hypothetical protein